VQRIAITPRDGRDIVGELDGSVACLRRASITPHTVRVEQGYGVIWVADEQLQAGIDALRREGFEATSFPFEDVPPRSIGNRRD
jgi:hypothetical protein